MCFDLRARQQACLLHRRTFRAICSPFLQTRVPACHRLHVLAELVHTHLLYRGLRCVRLCGLACKRETRITCHHICLSASATGVSSFATRSFFEAAGGNALTTSLFFGGNTLATFFSFGANVLATCFLFGGVPFVFAGFRVQAGRGGFDNARDNPPIDAGNGTSAARAAAARSVGTAGVHGAQDAILREHLLDLIWDRPHVTKLFSTAAGSPEAFGCVRRLYLSLAPAQQRGQMKDLEPTQIVSGLEAQLQLRQERLSTVIAAHGSLNDRVDALEAKVTEESEAFRALSGDSRSVLPHDAASFLGVSVGGSPPTQSSLVNALSSCSQAMRQRCLTSVKADRAKTP